MGPYDTEATAGGTLIDLRDDRPLTLRAKKDVVVHAFAGTVWITQQGDCADVILGPRETYVAPGCGSIVISAVDGRALVQLSEGGAEIPALRATPDVIGTIHSHASALRNAHLNDTAGALARGLLRIMRKWRTAIAS